MGQTDAFLQKSVFETLNQDASLISLMGSDKVFSHVTSKTDLPYIVISNWQTEDWSTSSDRGDLHRFEIDIWDDKRSTLVQQNIASRIIELLHDQPLELGFGNLVNLRFENSSLSIQGSNKLQPLNLKFRATIEF
ncbi:MAG: DUF3168 domain-containing protein [Lentilitoribacter sp.]